MNIEITKQERNELLDREDIELAIDHTGEATPSESAVRDKLAAELDLDPATIRIDHIHGSAGTGKATGEVKVFDEPVVDLSEDSEDEAEDDDSGAGAVDEVAVDIDPDEDEESESGAGEAADEGSDEAEEAAEDDEEAEEGKGEDEENESPETDESEDESDEEDS